MTWGAAILSNGQKGYLASCDTSLGADISRVLQQAGAGWTGVSDLADTFALRGFEAGRVRAHVEHRALGVQGGSTGRSFGHATAVPFGRSSRCITPL